MPTSNYTARKALTKGSSKGAGLVATVENAPEGQRNATLNWAAYRTRQDPELDPADMAPKLLDAAIKAGLGQREAVRTISSGLRAPYTGTDAADRPQTRPAPSEEDVETAFAHHPRLHPLVPGQKWPSRPWQYPWDEPNRYPDEELGDWYGMAVPPGTIVLDVDDKDLFNQQGLTVTPSPGYQDTPSGGYHVGYRLHPDRAVPVQLVAKAKTGFDTRVSGNGQVAVYGEGIMSDPRTWPLAPDWLQPATDDPGFRTITDYLRDVPEVIPWIVQDFLYEGGSTLISGPPKGGKSTLCSALMHSLEDGTPFLGRAVTSRAYALLTEEGGVPVRYKYGHLRALQIFDRKMAKGESWTDTLGRIDAWAKRHPGGVLFIDTLSVWASIADENDATAVTEAMDGINAVKDANSIAIVLIHHSRKGGGKDGEAIRGSGAILATVDHVIEVRRHERVKTQRYLDLMGRVLPENKRLLIDWDGAYRAYTEIDIKTDELDEIARWLEHVPMKDSGEPGLTTTELATTWECSRPTATRRAEHLADIGRMSQRKGKVGNATANFYWAIPPVEDVE